MKKKFGCIVLIAIIINIFSGLQPGVLAENSGVLLSIDYDNNTALPETFDGVLPKCETKEGSWGKYMEIQPSWGNSGYRLSSQILEDETEYTIKFDISMNGLRTDVPSIMLCEVDEVVSINDNVYHHFGLIKPTSDGQISVAGHTVSGLKYYEDVWYSYEMTFSRRTGLISGKIYQYENQQNVGTFDFLAPVAHYGNGMWERDYDAIKFNCNGTIRIDNILIYEGSSTPVKCSLKSDNVGNIFGNDDGKILKLYMANYLDHDAKVTFDYVIKDERGLTVSSDEGLELSLKAMEKKDYPLSFNITRYGTYDLFLKMKVEGEETFIYETKGYAFSIINSSKSDEGLNYETGVTVASSYIDTENEWNAIKEIALKAGIGALRSDLLWRDLQPSAGSTLSDDKAGYATIAYPGMTEAGIKNMAIIVIANPDYYGGYSKPYMPHQIGTDTAWQEWEAYVDWVSKEYKDSVTYWEIINEPNVSITPDVYSEYFNRAGPIIRNNDPDGKICALATSGVEYSWIEEALGYLDPQYVDVITVHPYDWALEGKYWGLDNWSTVFRDYAHDHRMGRFYDILTEKGFADTEVILTEVSVSSTPATFTTKGLSSQKMQASDLVQLYAQTKAKGFADSTYWYSLVCTTPRGYEKDTVGDRNGNFGLVGNKRDAVAYSAKPAYVAMAGVNKMLNGARYIDAIENVDTDNQMGTRAYRFERADEKQVIVLWAENTFLNIKLSLGAKNIQVYDKYTNLVGNMESEEGEYDFTATFEPMYIVGDFTEFERLSPALAVDSGLVECLKGDVITYTINDSLGRDLKVSAEGSNGAKVSNIENIVDGLGSVTVSTNPDALPEESIDIKVYDGDKMIYYGRVHAVTAEVYVDKILVNNKEVKSLEEITSGNVTLNLAANNLYNYKNDEKIIIAYYDQNQRLISLEIKDMGTISRGSNSSQITLSLPEDCAQMKLMLWGDTKEMRPLCDSIQIR